MKSGRSGASSNSFSMLCSIPRDLTVLKWQTLSIRNISLDIWILYVCLTFWWWWFFDALPAIFSISIVTDTALSAGWKNAYFSFLLFKDMNVNGLTVLFSVMFIRNPVIIVFPIYTQFPTSLFSDNKNVPDSQIENNSQVRSQMIKLSQILLPFCALNIRIKREVASPYILLKCALFLLLSTKVFHISS